MKRSRATVQYKCKLIRTFESEKSYHITYQIPGASEVTLMLAKDQTTKWDLIEASVGKAMVIERDAVSIWLVGLKLGRRQLLRRARRKAATHQC